MDTLFKLVSNSDQSYNSSSSSRNSGDLNQYYYLHQPQPEECFNSFFMEDEDHFSASSSSNNHRRRRCRSDQLQQFHCSTATTASTTTTGTTTRADQSLSPFIEDSNFEFSNEWASTLLLKTATAIIENNSSQIQQLMWILNELGSPYGNKDQKLAFYFLQAMFSRITDSGDRCYQTLAAVSENRSCFKSMRRVVMKFQEVSPWMTFGHVASNGAILEAFEGETKLHIIDISNSFCTQWPTFLEALATKSAQTPHLRLTTIIAAKSDGSLRVHKNMMKEISTRMEKFARLMGVPFKFKSIFHSGDISDINFTELGVNHDEAVAVNCIGALRAAAPVGNRRDFLLSQFGALRPRIITVVEEEADLDGDGDGGVHFVKDVEECLRWFRVYFDSLDGSFSAASDEKLMLERAAGRAVVDLLARAPAESVERRETAARWARRLDVGGFSPVSFSEDVIDDVRTLLRRHKDGWSVTEDGVGDGAGAGIFLTWNRQPMVWAAAWAPN